MKHQTVKTSRPGPNGEQYCWWQCTIKGGREGRDIGAVELAKAVEALGAGEILLNCIDNDGVGKVRWRGRRAGGRANREGLVRKGTPPRQALLNPSILIKLPRLFSYQPTSISRDLTSSSSAPYRRL